MDPWPCRHSRQRASRPNRKIGKQYAPYLHRHLKLEFLTRNKLNIEHCNQWYKNINKDNSNIDNYCRSFHPKSSRLDQIKIIRLRLGHTKLTHEHYFNQNQTSPCPFCQGDNNIPTFMPFTPPYKTIYLQKHKPNKSPQ